MAKYTSQNLNNAKGMSSKLKWGISLFVISFVLLVLVATNIIVPVHNFMLGVFGLSIYPVLLVLLGAGVLLMTKKEYYIAKTYLITIITLFFLIVCFFQLVLTNTDISFSEYMSNCYSSKNTAGGVIAGLLIYGLHAGLGLWGTIILEVIAVIVCVAIMIDYFLKMKEYKNISLRTVSYPVKSAEEKPENVKIKKVFKEDKTGIDKNLKEDEKVNITLDGYLNKKEEAKKALFEKTSYKSEDDMAIKIFGEDFVNSIKSNGTTKNEVKKEYTLSELYEENKFKDNSPFIMPTNKDSKPSRFIHNEEKPILQTKFQYSSSNSFENFKKQENEKRTRQKVNNYYDEPINDFKTKQNENNFTRNTNVDEFKICETRNVYNLNETSKNNLDDNKINDEVTENDFKPEKIIDLNEINLDNTDISEILAPKQPPASKPIPIQTSKSIAKPEQTIMQQSELPKPKKKTKPVPYVRPPLELLTTKSTQFKEGDEDFQQKAVTLEETLESFRIPAKVMGITRGPAVTRYELQMPVGIPVKKITQHTDDIAMMLESRASVRIETPIPGRSLVGVEVPNEQVATIGLKDVLDTELFLNSKAALTFALGKDIAGECKICNLDAMPHLLVAGSTGSGKSVCLNVILISLLYKLGPNDLKLILIDPKRVEFVTYNYLPHMLIPKAINDAQQALNALDWAIKEMTRRYDIFSEKNVKDFKEYNSLPEVFRGEEDKLPYIVIVIDELADLMMLAGHDLEEKIQRLTQLARAAGIHLIIATQRPSVNVITGVIKSNLPSRIAFAVTDFASSKTILDKGGAEKLLGRGDMLYSPRDLPEPIRIQCPFVDTKEVVNITNFIKDHNTCDFDDSISSYIQNGEKNNSQSAGDGGSDSNSWDPLLPRALMDFIQAGEGSASMIQRRHSIGYVRAGRIIDQMENAGFISAKDPAKQMRSVLITLDKYKEIFGEES